MTNEAKFHLSISEGVLQISGSELFVTQQIENFKDVILDSLANNEKPVKFLPANSPQPTQPTAPSSIEETADGNPYPNVLDFDGDQIHIICKVPGNNNSEKTNNIALIYLWAKQHMGTKSVSSKEIREQCEEHACFDPSNFASYLKRDKASLIVSGTKGGNKDCKLTHPGKTKAEDLLKELNAT